MDFNELFDFLWYGECEIKIMLDRVDFNCFLYVVFKCCELFFFFMK